MNLAPALEQIHIRVSSPTDPTPQDMAKLITELRDAFGGNLEIGLHPDNSKTSYSNWNCQPGNWWCVFNNSISYMNEVNSLVGNDGFNIFSIE